MAPDEAFVQQLEERFVAWARDRPDIRAAVVVGSRARVDHPADEWADLDIIFFTTQPERYLSNRDWLEEIGNVWVATLVRNVAGDPDLLVTFEGGLDVDFVPIPYRRIQWLLRLLRLLIWKDWSSPSRLLHDGRLPGAVQRATGEQVLFDGESP